MEFAINWVFRAGPGVWSLFIFVWIASTLGHLAFNHLRKEEKLLNTFKYGAFALAYIVLATGGEIANREDSRAMLPPSFPRLGRGHLDIVGLDEPRDLQCGNTQTGQ